MIKKLVSIFVKGIELFFFSFFRRKAKKGGKKTIERWHELVGKRFGRLYVIKAVGIWKGQVTYLCRCDCGNTTEVLSHHLKSGHTRSCGCLRREVARRMGKRGLGKGKNRTHGESSTRLYDIWVGMKQRCYNRNAPNYKWYGGKGIIVCPEWKDSYLPFRDWALAHGYQESLTLGRIDTRKGYHPENCRWITHSENVSEHIRKRYRRQTAGNVLCRT